MPQLQLAFLKSINRWIHPTRSQKESLKNHDIKIKVKPLEYRDEIFELTLNTQEEGLTKRALWEFKISFYVSCPSFQMEYTLWQADWLWHWAKRTEQCLFYLTRSIQKEPWHFRRTIWNKLRPRAFLTLLLFRVFCNLNPWRPIKTSLNLRNFQLAKQRVEPP